MYLKYESGNKKVIYLYDMSFRVRRHWSVTFMENLHIPMWLMKDMSWMMEWYYIGMCMIPPTVTVGLIILYRERHNIDGFLPNLAVNFWLIANCFWMIGDFFEERLSHISLMFFLFGIVMIVLYYYDMIRKKRIV